MRDETAALFEERGFDGYVLLTTERALSTVAGVGRDCARGVARAARAGSTKSRPQLLPAAANRPLVALGGGRVIDTAKAIAGARGGDCAAIPTTLSGAELTPFHRTPKDVPGARLVRPALVIADPELMASQPPEALAASAMNALAHAMEALYTPRANPVSELAALRGAELIGAALAGGPDRARRGRARRAARGLRVRQHRDRDPPRHQPDDRAHGGHAARRDERGDAPALRGA